MSDSPEYIVAQDSNEDLREMLEIYAIRAKPLEAATLREAAKRMERMETALARLVEELDDANGWRPKELRPGGSAYDMAKEAVGER